MVRLRSIILLTAVSAAASIAIPGAASAAFTATSAVALLAGSALMPGSPAQAAV
jgi:hypothetical protein